MEDCDCPEGWLGAELDDASGRRKFCIMNDKSAEVWLLSSLVILLIVKKKGVVKKEGLIKRERSPKVERSEYTRGLNKIAKERKDDVHREQVEILHHTIVRAKPRRSLLYR